MKKHPGFGMVLAGLGAGAVNGLFGAGGGMVLVPLLSLLTATAIAGTVAWSASLPYLAGSAAGGVLAGFLGKKIPTVWLHRGLGILIVWGGIRYLC